MLIQLTNTPLNYAWGSLSGISNFTGHPASGLPEAELWFGTHPGSPAKVVRTIPRTQVAHPTLDEWLRAEPSLAGFGMADHGELPILLKVLAAARPLSLQVHPTTDQAAAGYRRENALNIPLDSSHRNYKDAGAKPEIIVAVTEFDALCGFRPADEVSKLASCVEIAARRDSAIDPIAELLSEPTETERTVRWLLSGDAAVPAAVDALTAFAQTATATEGPCGDDFATLTQLTTFHPGDPGAVIALLMNRVRLSPGQCLFAPAGMLHAYLSGVGIELMSASDNVVRGGLTEKHLDVDELIHLLSFEQTHPQLCEPERKAGGSFTYRPPAPFELTHLTSSDAASAITLAGPSLLLVQDGEWSVSVAASTEHLKRGDALFAPMDESPLHLEGHGNVWIATALDESA